MLSAVLAVAGATSAAVKVRVSGPPVDVWSALDSLHRCHAIDVPDIPARVFDANGVTKMVVGSTAYHHMSGPSALQQTRSCEVAYNKTGDPDPAMFAANEFLDSTVIFPNGTVVALVHTEYPGNAYNSSGPTPPMCDSGKGYPECWTVTIGLVISHNAGATWQHARPPPHHLVASVPYKYNQSQLASGWGDPSNIVKNPRDGLYYTALWNRHQVGLQPPGICIMRTADLTDPSAWRAWGGPSKGYSVSFVSPYTMTPGTEAEHVCTVTDLPAGDVHTGCAPAGLVWSTHLQKFVMTLGCLKKEFYLATSSDLITWSTPQPLDVVSALPANISKMVLSTNYPTFIDPSAGPNYDTIGKSPYLYWVSMGHSPYVDGRHLWASPMTFD